MPATLSRPTPGIIEPGVLYGLDEFSARTGMKRFALRSARRRGLPVLYVGNRAFIDGGDAIEFFRRDAKASR